MRRKKPGPGFKRFQDGWGKNINFIWLFGRWVMVKKDPAKESCWQSDWVVFKAPTLLGPFKF